MPTPDSTPLTPPSASRPTVRGHAWRAAVIAAGIALVVALVFDQWHQRHLQVVERARVRNVMAPYANALQGAVERRISLLVGLRSFADSRPSRRALDEEFPVFAQGILSGADGVRALQFVEDGRIVLTWPVVGNEPVVHYNLLDDPRPLIGADVLRAMSSGEITLTGPIALVQGGEGLIVRQRVSERAPLQGLAAIIVDVPRMVREAGLPMASTGLLMEVRDGAGGPFGGDAAGRAIRPETLTVRVPDGDWMLLGAPVVGWRAAVRPELTASRLTSIALVLIAGLLGTLLGGREERLVREVSESGTRLDLALRAGNLGAWEGSIARRELRFSEAAAAILGAVPAELDGQVEAVAERIHVEDREAFMQGIIELLLGNDGDYMIEARARHADGSDRWVLAIGQLERNEAGQPIRVIGVLSDVTERREIEERLRHSQRLAAVGTLAGGVAHDFNNLLTAIIGFTELARERVSEFGDDPLGHAIREDLGQVLATSERAAALTGQLLAFSRRTETAPKPVDIAEAVRALEPMLKRLLGDAIPLRSDLASGLWPVLVDPAQLTQVLLNLIVNARDAMPDGGAVDLRLFGVTASSSARPLDAPTGDWVCLEVTDCGLGMPADVQARIFEPYFTTKEIGRGTGLGLAMVYGAVETAGGQVTVRSAEGTGTTFCVYLPPLRVTAEYPVTLGAVVASA